MIYNKALVLSRQKAVIKSITDLLNILSEIEVGDSGGNSGEIVLDDGSVMTLSATAGKGGNLLHVEKISVTNAKLNIDLVVNTQDDSVIRLVKKKPEKIIIKLKKKDSDE